MGRLGLQSHLALWRKASVVSCVSFVIVLLMVTMDSALGVECRVECHWAELAATNTALEKVSFFHVCPTAPRRMAPRRIAPRRIAPRRAAPRRAALARVIRSMHNPTQPIPTQPNPTQPNRLPDLRPTKADHSQSVDGKGVAYTAALPDLEHEGLKIACTHTLCELGATSTVSAPAAAAEAAALGHLGRKPLGRIESRGDRTQAAATSGHEYVLPRNQTREAGEYLTRTAHFRPYFDELVGMARGGVQHAEAEAAVEATTGMGSGNGASTGMAAGMAAGDQRAHGSTDDGAPRRGMTHVAVWLFSYPNSGTTWTQELLREAVGIQDSTYKAEGGKTRGAVACNRTTNRYCHYYYKDSRALDKAVGKPRRKPAIIKSHRAPRCFEEVRG